MTPEQRRQVLANMHPATKSVLLHNLAGSAGEEFDRIVAEGFADHIPTQPCPNPDCVDGEIAVDDRVNGYDTHTCPRCLGAGEVEAWEPEPCCSPKRRHPWGSVPRRIGTHWVDEAEPSAVADPWDNAPSNEFAPKGPAQ